MRKRKTRYDWKLIQERYDAGLTCRDIQSEFGFASASLTKAIHRGDFTPRSKSEAAKLSVAKNGRPALSEETKRKISNSRIKYLQENPDKVPYIINHSSKESYPEKVFRKALESSGITGWQQSYRAGIYEYDFAFTEEKIDVEIDGSTHNLEKVKRIDERRDEWSRQNGWRVIRFTTQEVREDVVGCINRLKELLRQST
jgi:very-short-patch-repair endonuclease